MVQKVSAKFEGTALKSMKNVSEWNLNFNESNLWRKKIEHEKNIT